MLLFNNSWANERILFKTRIQINNLLTLTFIVATMQNHNYHHHHQHEFNLIESLEIFIILSIVFCPFYKPINEFHFIILIALRLFLKSTVIYKFEKNTAIFYLFAKVTTRNEQCIERLT